MRLMHLVRLINRSAHNLAKKLGVDAPIIEGIYRVIHEGADPKAVSIEVWRLGPECAQYSVDILLLSPWLAHHELSSTPYRSVDILQSEQCVVVHQVMLMCR
jgi:hypothetical protein